MNDGPGWQVRGQELAKSECFEPLSGERLGRAAVMDDQRPITFAVNLVLDRHMVAFRTDEGIKLGTVARGGRVAFEVNRGRRGGAPGLERRGPRRGHRGH